MAQFDVFRTDDGSLLVDCQSAALRHLATRLSVPLLPLDRAPEQRPRLNPTFTIEGKRHALVTQFVAAVSTRELRVHVVSLAGHRDEIIGAFDILLTGV